MAPHLALVDRYLMRLVDELDELDRLMIFMPPRSGKSEFISKVFPSWVLGTRPTWRTIIASHTQNLASYFGGKARDLLDERGLEDFGIQLSDKTKARDEWEVAGHGGGLVAAGVGGPITGRGANVMVIDDPIKNAEEAISPVYREKQWQWWESTASTRLEPGASVVLMNTRWHEDDLAGRLLKIEGNADDGGRWHVVSLPALAETDDDPLGRKIGEALWPERYPESFLEKLRHAKTPYWWQAMYQQRPGLFGESSWPASYFDNLWCEEWPETFDFSVIAIDPALGRDKQKGDYSALAFVGRVNGLLYVDCKLIRVPPPELVDIALSWYVAMNPTLMVCEEVGFQELLGGMLKAKAEEMGLLNLTYWAVQNTGHKITRIEAGLTDILSRGLVRLRAGSAGANLLCDQLRAIPNGDHDDGPDALEMAVRAMAQWYHGQAAGGRGDRMVTVQGDYR